MRTLCFFAFFVSLLNSQASGADRIYQITAKNRANSNLASIVWATHGRRSSVFNPGEKAGRGLARLAEDGITSKLKKEMKRQQNGSRGVNSIGETFGIRRKGQETCRVRTDSLSGFLSWASTAESSNDTFAGQSRPRLPRRINQTIKRKIVTLDGGSKVNTESRNDVPCLGSHNVGQAENGVIRKSDAIRGDADLNQSRGWGQYIATIRMRCDMVAESKKVGLAAKLRISA